MWGLSNEHTNGMGENVFKYIMCEMDAPGLEKGDSIEVYFEAQ